MHDEKCKIISSGFSFLKNYILIIVGIDLMVQSWNYYEGFGDWQLLSKSENRKSI